MKKNVNTTGQALITFIVFSLIALAVTTALTATIITNTYGANRIQLSENTLQAAESGIENAIIRMLRNSSYAGETIQIDDSSVDIIVSGTNPKTIESVSNQGAIIRKIVATVNISGMNYELLTYSEEF